VGGAGLLVDALDMDKGASRLGLCDLGVVGDDTIQETATRLGVFDVLNADIDALGEDAAANALVDDDTDGALGDVENAASGTVVHFVGHTLLDGTVALDVDDITLKPTKFELNVRMAPWITIVLPRGKRSRKGNSQVQIVIS